MTRKRKGQHYNPANTPDNRKYRVQRSDGIILARGLERKEAEKVKLMLEGEHTSESLRYVVKLEDSPVIDLRDYLAQ